MKRLHALAATVLICAAAAALPARADEPLAGATLFSVSHGQPFCRTRAALQALLDAQISHADIGLFSFPGCTYVEDNTLVAIGQDYRGGRYMHIVRARAKFLLGGVDGYTFSAGLYALPVRSALPKLNPFY